MEFYILKEDAALENSERYAMRGDILVLPVSYSDRSSGILRLEYPSWNKLNGAVVCSTAHVSIVAADDAFLLLGIDDAFQRLKFFQKPRALDDAHLFQPGAAVTFEYFPSYTFMDAAIVFRGEIESLDGIRFGLEIMGNCSDLKKEDISEGYVNGKQYFKCSPGRGVITSIVTLMLSPQRQKAANRIRQAAANLDKPAAAAVRTSASPRSSNPQSVRTSDHPRADIRSSASAPLPASKSDHRGGSRVFPGMRARFAIDEGEVKSGIVKVLEARTMPNGRSHEVALLEMDPPYRRPGTDGMVEVPVLMLQYEPSVFPPSKPLSERTPGASIDLGRNGSRSDRVTAAASPNRPSQNLADAERTGQVLRAGDHRPTRPQPADPFMTSKLEEMSAAQQQIMDSYNNSQAAVTAAAADSTANPVYTQQERMLAQFRRNGAAPQHKSSSPKTSSRPDVSRPDPEPPRNASTTSSTAPNPTPGSMQTASTSGGWQSLDIGSMVELPAMDRGKLHGVIRWIGQSGDNNSIMFAGVELDDPVTTGTNGLWQGKQRFTCVEGRAVFPRLDQCQPDGRFGPSETKAVSNGDRPSDHRVATTPVGAGDSEKERALRKLKASDVRVTGDIIAHLPQKMEEFGQIGRWRALVERLGYSGSDIRALVSPEAVDLGASLLTVLWHWTENKAATFGQLGHALCDIRSDDIAFTLLVPALDKASAQIAPKGIASNSQSSRHSQNGVEESQPLPGAYPPAPRVMVGRNKGIQGHYNSCYMDSTLFAMFAHSLAFDGALHKVMHTETGAAEGVQKHLLENIVNPLRAKGFVSSKHIMSLRHEFDRLGDVKGLTDAEKDPEEFLNLMWQTILKADPFLKLKAPQHDDSTYIYQLFVQPDGDKKVATVQELLERSFSESELTLREAPSVLVLQMPRFGRQFKPFDKIIPSLTLDITNLLTEGSRQCGLCGQAASITCHSCRKELNSSRANDDGKRAAGRVRNRSLLQGNGSHANYCDVCSKQVHRHRTRRGHKPQRIGECRRPLRHDLVADQLESMELFAVICIETSHYVSFVKCDTGNDDDQPAGQQPGDSKWCFFDSMADRVGEQDGFNIPEVKPLPTLVEWVTDPVRVANASTRDMPAEIRRLLCDPYMCLYQNKNMLTYG